MATAARQGTLRELNLGLVLREVLDASATHAPPPSRADVAAATGLTRATVSALVDRLVAGGLLAELDPAQTQRVGRPAVPLVPAGGTVVALGAEINVDYLAVRALDLRAQVLAETVVLDDHRGSDPSAVLRALAAVADDVADRALRATGRRARLVGSALALPGLVARDHGTLLLAPNLGWREVDVARTLADASRVLAQHAPYLANEADLAARAEVRAQRRAGTDSFVYVSGEIGIGAAIVLDAHVFGGRHGWAGELGHTITADGRRLEQVAGQDAVLRAAGLERSAGVAPLLDALAAGDAAAQAAVAAAGEALGLALADVVNAVDVSDVLLGGIYAHLADHVTQPVLDALRTHVLAAPWAPPAVEVARAGELPAVTGAALTVLDRVVADPAAWLVAEPPSSPRP